MTAAAMVAVLLAVPAATAVGCSSFTPSEARDDAAPPDDAAPLPSDGTAPPIDAGEAGRDASDAGCVTCVLATGQAGAEEIAASSTHVAWTMGGANGAVRAVPRGGGAVRDLAALAVQPKSLELIGPTGFSFVEGQDVKLGDTTETTLLVQGTVAVVPLTAARHVGGSLFVAHKEEIKYCSVNADLACAVAIQTSGAVGPITSFANIEAGPSVWYTAAPTTIQSRDATSFTVGRTWTDGAGARLLQADAQRVYWVDAANDVVARPVAAASGGPKISRGVLPASPGGAALDATYLYFSLPSKGSVVRLTKDGLPALAVIAEKLDAPSAIAVHGNRVFVVAADTILSFPKDP